MHQDKDANIAELEALLSDQNNLKQQLVETKCKLESAKKKVKQDPEANKVAKLGISTAALEYDPDKDKVITKNEDELNRLVEEHCKANKNRDIKKSQMKNKVLEKVRIIERKRRGLSPTKSKIRNRSDDIVSETDGSSHKSLQASLFASKASK